MQSDKQPIATLIIRHLKTSLFIIHFKHSRMNKKFLNMMLCSLLAGSMATSFVGCKDYDDDITEINSTTGVLSQQLKDLNAALETAKADAEAAKAAASQATDAASKALEAAKAAAAEAKAEALKEVIAKTEELQQQISANTNLSKENAEALAALSGRINGIEQGLSNIDLTDINKQLGDQATLIAEANKQIQAIQTQISALEAYQTQLKALGTIEELKEQLAAINTIKSDLNTLLGKVNANTIAIEEVKGELVTISGKISTEVTNGINTIAAVISQRLTSVTLMPDLYVGGIPTIAFESAEYTKKEFKNNKWQNATTGTVNFIISNNETEAQYRLNPGTVTNEDIILNEMAYVSRVATARSAETADNIVNVASANVGEYGILTVKLGKANTGSLNRNDGKINTVALRVPIAAKHLFTEQGETSANVYSEYTRIEETYFQPEIIYVPGANIDKATNTHPYADSLKLYSSVPDAEIARHIVYNKPFNLYELIEGCKFFAPSKHEAMTIEQVRKYGMDINFQVATKAYQPTIDKTDQQEWVKLSGENNSLLTPVTNKASGNLTDNEAIIGKQPIIRATLFDKVNNNVIDVRYFKVKFTAEDMEPVVFDWDIETTGTPCDGATVNMTWDEVAKRILVNLNGGKGMSKEDFNTIYGTNYTVNPVNNNDGTFVATVNSETSASIPVFTWSVNKEQLGKLKEGNNTATYKKTVTFTNTAGLYPNVVINFTFTVNTTVSAVTLGKTDELKWGTNNTMKVYVVPMEIPYVSGTSPKAHYATNILEGRTKPYVNDLASCAYYDIDFATGQGYVGKALEFQTGYGHWLMTSTNQANLNTITYSIDNNDNGKKLASEGKTITLEWKSNINGLSYNPDNRYTFGTMKLQVLRILNLNPESAKAITDNSAVQSTDVAVTITDAYGNLVAEKATTNEPLAADYWDFYGVQKPTFTGTIEIADDANGKNSRSLASLNMTANVDADGKLTFQNNGAPIQADAYLMVPVKVEHLWGTLSGKVAVPLKKNPNLSTSSHR